tara:strand:+ start:803 stop:1168 length:366 start_codon:yes stop_codon:yes gene_type:complete
MSELKIPNLNNKSRQFLFKNKLTLRRKSKTKILSESLLMLISAFVLICLNLLIPQKKVLIYSFMDNIYKIYFNFLDFIKYFYQIILVLLIVSSALVSVILIIGALSRLYKIIMGKTKKHKY